MNYMILNQNKVNTALAALRCITSLTLRNPECARTLVNDQNAAEAIVNALNCHSKNKAATRAGKSFRGKLFLQTIDLHSKMSKILKTNILRINGCS